MANRWQTARAAADEANRLRLELLRRLETMLEDRGFVPWNEHRARPDDPVEIKLTLEELAELVGALNDASQTFALRDELHRYRAYLRDVTEELRGARNPRDVLRRFGLVEDPKKRRLPPLRDSTLHERLELARFYHNLIASGPLIPSPRFWRSLDEVSPSPRDFGAVLAVDHGPPADNHRAPVSLVEAVRIVQAGLGCKKPEAARERLIDARDAIREARQAGLLRPAYRSGSGTPDDPYDPPPPFDPPDDFPIPDPTQL